VQTERWRYTQWDRGAKGEELYDQENDPQELHNPAALPKYAATLAEMKALLKQAHPVPVHGGKAEPGTRAKFSN
jgi:arylsulfatase A-like enzyme